MRFQDLNWMDIERYLEHDNRVIVISGATEQHAYLSVLTDILIPSRMALAAAEQTHVLIAPPLNFGVSDEFAEFPGTISISRSTFEVLLNEVIDSLLHQGFARFFILNGHGGNRPSSHLRDLTMEGLAAIDWYDWWQSEAAQRFEAQYGLKIDHANWGENFPFNRVAEVPEGEKAAINLTYIETGASMRTVLGDGSFGGPYSVDDALMQTLFGMVVEEIVERIERL